MLNFAQWLFKEIGMIPPRQEVVIFRCDYCGKNRPIEEMRAEQNRKGYIKKICNNCL